MILTETVIVDQTKKLRRTLHQNGDTNNNKDNPADMNPSKVDDNNNDVKDDFKLEFVWINIIAFVYLHMGALYGLYLTVASSKASTNLFMIFTLLCGSFGVTAGAHRLWSHKSYKAKLPLRIILMIFNSLAFQNSIYEWVRDHRVHHKFTDTNADPHNSRRGFFFSHMGWLMVRKHPDVKIKGATIDMSDLEQDGVVMFQKKYYGLLMPFFCFFMQTWIPVFFWNETVSNAWYVAAICRYTIQLNGTWCVNSYAHFFGTRPYDKNISPTDSYFVGLLAVGEGWHNYHHVFPWDYKAAELSGFKYNLTTGFLDIFAKLGWAYDLKTVSETMIQKRLLRTGDGSHRSLKYKDIHVTPELFMKVVNDAHNDEGMVWGWDDADMSHEDKADAKILGASNEK